MSGTNKGGPAGQQVAQAPAPGTVTTAAWPRNVSGRQAFERIKTYLNDELFPLVNRDEHFRSGEGLAVVEQMPQLMAYLQIAQDWAVGTGAPPTGGGTSQGEGRPRR